MDGHENDVYRKHVFEVWVWVWVCEWGWVLQKKYTSQVNKKTFKK